MILASPILNLRPTIWGRFSNPLAVTTKPFLGCSFSSTKLSSALLKCHCCTHNKDTDKYPQGFSVLTSDIPWKTGSLWSTMALYMLNLHIPLGFGGLSIVAYILHQPVLDPQTQALSLLVIDILELFATLFLLNRITRPEKRLVDIFESTSAERNWLLASALGFGILIFIVFLTSIVIDGLFGVKDVNNPVLKEMFLRSDISKVACIIVYCIITPILEEVVYRGFMLTYLASTMDWKQAVLISAAIFSAAHFSGENFLQLLVIGCILGCSYCGTGNLCSSIVVHSLYNAFTLLVTFLS